MKKNLRIVSAAAAALLAVAPVAAAAVAQPASVNADVKAPTKQVVVKSGKTKAKGVVYLYNRDKNGKMSENASSVADPLKDGQTITIIGSKLPGSPKYPAGWYNVAVNGKESNLYISAGQVEEVKSNKPATTTHKSTIPAVGSNAEVNDNTAWAYKIQDDHGKYQANPDINLSKGTVVTVIGEPFTASKNGGIKLIEVLAEDKTGKTVKAYVNVKQISEVKKASDVTTPSTTINAPSTTIFDADGNVDPAISAVAASDGNTSALVGQVNVSLHGQNYVALLHGAANTRVYRYAGKKSFHQVSDAEAKHLHAGVQYYARLNDVTVNLGNAEAGKTEKFTLTKGWFEKGNAGTYSDEANSAYYRTVSVTVDKDGIAHLGQIMVPFNAYDANNLQEVHIYDIKTGNVVTSGSVDLHAVNSQLNVEAVRRAIRHEYTGKQLDGGVKAQPVYFLNNLRDQLKKQNISVNDEGYFKTPSKFTVNVTYKSVINGAEATIPVTVNVDNATASTPANETTKNVTIMHISTIYDKNGNATKQPALRAYNSVSVVSDPVTINGAKFYKLAGKDEYIKVGNVDGTSRSLKHNAYVYKANGKAIKVSKKHHKVLKNGASVTTYGKSFKNDVLGTQVYRIGRNQYVKVANFR